MRTLIRRLSISLLLFWSLTGVVTPSAQAAPAAYICPDSPSYTGKLPAEDGNVAFIAVYDGAAIGAVNLTSYDGKGGRLEQSYQVTPEDGLLFTSEGSTAIAAGKKVKLVTESAEVRFSPAREVQSSSRARNKKPLPWTSAELAGLLAIYDKCASQVRENLTERSGTYLAASGTGVTALHLLSDLTALVLSDQGSRQPVTVHRGTWYASRADQIAVRLSDDSHQPATLYTVRDGDLFGEGGLLLVRATATASGLLGSSWQWVGLTGGGDEPLFIERPQSFLISFGENEGLGFLADCNRGSGRYLVNGQRMALKPGIMTKMYCGDASLDRRFLGYLSEVVSFRREGERLLLELPYGSGFLVFEPYTEAARK